MSIVKVGCCGWAVRGGRRAYFKEFNLIEIQSTFYKLPRLETALKWKEEAPESFEFTLKAWQVITHSPKSPTWRRSGIKISKETYDRYGFFRPTKENLEAWEKNLEICKALNVKICIFQSPPSFRPVKENIKNMEIFFTTIARGSIYLAWEPRGEWYKRPDLVKKLCDELDIIHVVDILKRKPLSSHDIAYIRLHGLNGDINYKYKYTDEDLIRLSEEVKWLIKEKNEIYVLFNNIYMAEDAKRFLNILKRKGII